MKNLLVLALLIPSLSFGQRFEVSEQAGYNVVNSFLGDSNPIRGFTNQVSFSYHHTKHFSVSAFYELNAWEERKAIIDNIHSLGIMPDFTSKYFNAGMSIRLAYLGSVYTPYTNYNYKTSLGYGVHIGSKQRIYKRLSAVEQVGYDRINAHGSYPAIAYIREPRKIPVTQFVSVYYLCAGLSYGL